MKKLFLLCIGLFSFSGYSQLNMTFLSNLNYQIAHDAQLANIWGYVDEAGNEYALVGTSKGVSVVNVTNPIAPVEVFWLPGVTNIWRELKVFGDYVYITTEGGEGLTIIDLSPLPNSSTLNVSQYFGPSGNEWQSSHTIFIDENGYAYISGANRGNGGIIILDVFTNPMAPIEVGVFDNWYSHDCFARNDTLFGAHISDGFFSIVDVSNKANPVLLGTKATPNFFTHNVWQSDNGNYLFTTDEKPGSFIAAYDFSNTGNIVEVDRIQTSPGSGVIPHNTHVKGDFIVTSYYRDGVTIHDVSRPNNMVEVGKFDTSPLSGNGFNGCWGVYPYLPSGNIIASDMEGGLFVLGANYLKGAYAEGVITDSVTNLPIQGALVSIQNEVQTDLSKLDGKYAVGTVQNGLMTITYSKQGYYSKTLNLNLVNNQVINQDIQLVPLPPFSFTLQVLDQTTNLPINDADIRLKSIDIIHEGVSNGLGEEDFILFYQENYDVIVGKWGYKTSCQSATIDQNTGNMTVFLTPGIYDDFSFDFGWIISGTAATGLWERAIPFGEGSSANASVDAEYDCSNFAYVTGNLPTQDADADDVDGGNVKLISPNFDLSSYTDPIVNYSRYFFNDYGPLLLDDTLQILLSNGVSTVLVDKVGRDTANFYQWVFKSIRVADYLSPTANMSLIVKTSDLDPNVNITEAGFDFFSVSNSPLLGHHTPDFGYFELFPNPTREIVYINTSVVNQEVQIFNSVGALVYNLLPVQSTFVIDMSNFEAGLYWVRQGAVVKKFIKN